MIGEKIKQARIDKELTQEQLANELLVSRSTISSWEVGRSYPDLEMIVRLSDYFDESLDALIREEEQMVKHLSYNSRLKKLNLGLIILLASVILFFIGNLFLSLWSQEHPLALTAKNVNVSQFKLTETTDPNQDWNMFLDFKAESKKWYLSPLSNATQAFYSEGNLYLSHDKRVP